VSIIFTDQTLGFELVEVLLDLLPYRVVDFSFQRRELEGLNVDLQKHYQREKENRNL